jgi:guanine deaminase
MIIQGRLLLDPSATPEPGWICVEGDRITRVEAGDPPAKPDFGGQDDLISPAFIDAHIHLPQVTSIGYDGMELLDWLQRVIFPAEMRWHDERPARGDMVNAMLRMAHAGTCGFASYLTAHATGVHLAEKHDAWLHGMRGIVGQVLMDRNAPAELTGHEPINPVTCKPVPSVELSINPRFAVSCTPELLARSSELAACAGNARVIQTHLAESVAECELIAKLFPDAPHYTGAYDSFGLLTPRTLLAHCVHLSDAERELIAARRSVVVHCPTANTFLRAGMFDLSAALEFGLRLALGTDVAAGPDFAMPRVARAMIEVAKLRAVAASRASHIPTPADAWAMITRGNAQALGWSDTGRLEAGCRADLLVIRVPGEMDEHLLGRLIYNWDDALIATRIFGGLVVNFGNGGVWIWGE